MNSAILKNEEKIVFDLRELYDSYGYRRYKMSKFEEYDLYARNKDFLISDQIITFTDTNGKLMALKPDVTLSIIKNSKDGETAKVYYDEHVYRVTGAHQGFKEIQQVGLECIGDIDSYRLYEVVMLAAESLRRISEESVLDISHLGVVNALVDKMELSADKRAMMLRCLEEKNPHEMKNIAPESEYTAALEKLISLYGAPADILPELKAALPCPEALKALEELERVTALLEGTVYEKMLRIDFSAAAADKYYNGIALKGFVKGIPDSVLSGGQYSKLMRRMGRKSDAVGFAVYLDLLERMTAGGKKYDIDTLLLYTPEDDIKALSRLAETLSKEGSVSVMTAPPENLTYRRIVKFGEKE